MSVPLTLPMPFSERPGTRLFPALAWLGLVGAGALPLMIAAFPPDAAGWALLPLTYAVLLVFPEFRRDGRLAAAGVGVLTAHHLVAIFNAYLGTVVGADLDAATFHLQASQLAQGYDVADLAGTGTSVYVHFLAAVYHLLGASHFLGEELSVLAVALSCAVLVQVCGLLGVSRFAPGMTALFGLSLSGLIFLSITLRESWQVLFVLLSTYWALRVRSRVSPLTVTALLLSAAGLGALHSGLVPYAAFLVIFSLFWGLGTGRAADIVWKRALLLTVAAILLAGVAASVQKLGGAGAALASGKALQYAQDYRLHGVREARAAYGVMLDVSTPAGAAATLPAVLVQYMFAPFPWQIGSPLDIEAMLEGWVRLALLVTSWRAWRLAVGEARSRVGFLFGLFLTMEFLWALGTINWGTAIRHHILAYGLLVLTGGPGLLLSLDRARRALLLPGVSEGAGSRA